MPHRGLVSEVLAPPLPLWRTADLASDALGLHQQVRVLKHAEGQLAVVRKGADDAVLV